MKNHVTITYLLLASSALCAQTMTNTSRGVIIGGIATPGDPGTAVFDFVTDNAGAGSATAEGLFTGVSGANRALTWSQNAAENPDGSGNLNFTFDTPGQYVIRLGDFDISTTSSAVLTVAANFTSVNSGAGASGVALGGSFNATQTTGATFDLDTIASGENGSSGTNGFIELTYTVAQNETLSFVYTDNTGANDALAWTVTQLQFTPVPEPSTTLLGALAGLGFLGRRKRA